METIKMGKRGTLVLPAKLRKQFGLEDGSLLTVEMKDGHISLCPAVACEYEVYTPQRIAQFLLNNALTKEEWDEAAQEIRTMGFDPFKIEFTDPGARETLPSRQQMNGIFQTIEAKHGTLKSA